jgi:Flp pilus assembly protein TadG
MRVNMVKRLLRRLASSRDGSVILETALMLTILLIMMFGIIDMGRALFTSNNLVSAAREGARFAAIDQTVVADTLIIKDTVRNHFSPFGGPALTRANIATTLVPGNPPSSIRITIKYPFSWITPIRRLVGAMRDTLHAQAEYRYEF